MTSYQLKPTAAVSKKSIWKSKLLWAVLILLVAGGGAAWYFKQNSDARTQVEAQAISRLQSSPVQRGDITVSASGSGSLVASQSIDLSFSTSGTVGELNVAVGDFVEAGDVLARLESADNLEAAVSSARYQLLEAQQELADLQDNADLSLAQAYADLVNAQIAYDDAVEANQRTANARCSEAVRTKYAQALDRATTKLNNINASDVGSDAWIDAKNDFDTAQANFNYCAGYTNNEKTNAQAEEDLAKATLEDAQENYDQLTEAAGIDPDKLELVEAKLEEAQYLLDNAQEDLEGITLTAPFAGKITYLAAQAGTIVSSDNKYITLSDISTPTLDISMDQADLDKLVVGYPVTVTFDALDGQSFNGAVTQVDPELLSAGPFTAAQGQVQLDDASVKVVQTLPLGASATVTIIAAEVKDVLMVPTSALKELVDGGYAVVITGADGQQQEQAVEIGLQSEDYAEVLSGLTEGQLVSTGTAAANKTDEEEMGFPGMDGGMMPPSGGGGGMMP